MSLLISFVPPDGPFSNGQPGPGFRATGVSIHQNRGGRHTALILWRNPQQTLWRYPRFSADAFALGGGGLIFVNHNAENTMRQDEAKFHVGQVVTHLKFGYRGVVFDVDPAYAGSDGNTFG
jgi:hypothetical protein